MLENHIGPIIKQSVNNAFRSHSINNQTLENAIGDILTDRTVIKELAKVIAENQGLEEKIIKIYLATLPLPILSPPPALQSYS